MNEKGLSCAQQHYMMNENPSFTTSLANNTRGLALGCYRCTRLAKLGHINKQRLFT